MARYSRSIIDPTEEAQARDPREVEMERVTRVLMANKDFRTWICGWMEMERFYAFHGELSSFEQGKKALLSKMVESLVSASEDYGKVLMNEGAQRYACIVQSNYKKKK